MELTKEQKEVLEFAEIKLGKASQISDGYHTFEQVYMYRMLYNAGMISLLDNNQLGIRIEKSKRHHDGELCFGGGYFIVTISGPFGQISNHYKLEHWDLFACREVETPSEPWDGHTPDIAEERLRVLVSKIAEYIKPKLRRSGRTTKIVEESLDWLVNHRTDVEPFNSKNGLIIPRTSFNSSYSYNFVQHIHMRETFHGYVPKLKVVYDHYSQEHPNEYRSNVILDLVSLMEKIAFNRNIKLKVEEISNLYKCPIFLVTVK